MNKSEKQMLFTRETSGWFKGLAIVMVILSHYAEWWSWFRAEEGMAEMIRDGISRFGPYGVAIFLLFSGYGLAKSAGEKRIGVRFILKRLTGVYLPYILMVVLIEILSGGFETLQDLADILYGQDFWYMTVMFSFYIAFMVIWLVFVNRHVRVLLLMVFTMIYSNYLYMEGEYDFWYISNAAFAVGTVLAVYEPVCVKVIDKIGVVCAVLFGAGLVYIVYSALCVEHIWSGPADEVASRVTAVFVFTMFIVFAAALWKWYGPVGRFLGRYSLYFYLSHTFLFMWVVNHFEYGIPVRFLIATIVILVVSGVMGIGLSRLTDIFYHKVENLVDFKHRKG